MVRLDEGGKKEGKWDYLLSWIQLSAGRLFALTGYV